VKALVSAVIVVVLVHLLAAGGFVGWLAASDRISGQRVRDAVAVFRPTIADEKADAEEAARVEAEAAAVAADAARREAVADGPQTLTERLALKAEASQLAEHEVERLLRERADLTRRMAGAREQVEQMRAELEADRAAFEQRVEAWTDRQQEDDFRQAVKLAEQLPPKQAKAMLRELIDAGETDRAIDYLAAMNQRKAAVVLSQFKDEDEVATATALIEGLRQRSEAIAGDGAADDEPDGGEA